MLGFVIVFFLSDDESDVFSLFLVRKIINIWFVEFNLYKINIKEDMPLIYYTNIMFYDNFNQTLPLGMNVKSKVLIDSDKLEFIPVNMITFNISDDFLENEIISKPTIKKIMLCEYDVKLKEQKKEEVKENE